MCTLSLLLKWCIIKFFPHFSKPLSTHFSVCVYTSIRLLASLVGLKLIPWLAAFTLALQAEWLHKSHSISELSVNSMIRTVGKVISEKAAIFWCITSTFFFLSSFFPHRLTPSAISFHFAHNYAIFFTINLASFIYRCFSLIVLIRPSYVEPKPSGFILSYLNLHDRSLLRLSRCYQRFILDLTVPNEGYDSLSMSRFEFWCTKIWRSQI